MSLNGPFLSSIYIGDGIWLPRTMARGGQSSVSKNRSSGRDVERSLLREWGWRGPAHLLYKRCRLFRPRRRDLDFGRASNCYEEVARRHRNWYFQHSKQLLLWIRIYVVLSLFRTFVVSWGNDTIQKWRWAVKKFNRQRSTVNGIELLSWNWLKEIFWPNNFDMDRKTYFSKVW